MTEEGEKKAQLNIKPYIANNPAPLLKIGANIFSKQEFEFAIYDLNGKLVLNKQNIILNKMQTFEQSFYLESGCYFVNITNVSIGFSQTLKWIKN